MVGHSKALSAQNNYAPAFIEFEKAISARPNAYAMMSGVAVAPDADERNRANMVLVSALLGRMNDAKAYGANFGMPRKDVNEILKTAANARSQGVSAFGIARSN